MQAPAPQFGRDSRDQNSGGKPIGGSAWLTLFLLTLTYGIYTLDKYVVAVVIEPLKHTFGLTDGEVGLLTGVAGTLPFLLTCIPIGMLADRVNRKWLLVGLVMIWSVFTGFGGLATSVFFLTTARVGVTALEAGFTPLAMSIMGDTFPPRRRPTAYGIFNLGAMFGVFLSMSVGGIVVAAYGWRWAFFLAGVPGFVMGLILAVVERDRPRGAFDGPADAKLSSPERPSLFGAVRSMWKTPVLRYSTLGLLCSSILPAALATWAASLLIRRYGLPVQQAGFGGALIGLSAALGAASGGILADWAGRKQMARKLAVPVLGSLAAIALGVGGLLFASNALVAISLLCLMAFVHAFYAGPSYSFIVASSSIPLRGTIIAVVLVATNVISGTAGNVLVGFISEMAGPRAGPVSISYGICGVLGFNVFSAFFFWKCMIAVRVASGE